MRYEEFEIIVLRFNGADLFTINICGELFAVIKHIAIRDTNGCAACVIATIQHDAVCDSGIIARGSCTCHLCDYKALQLRAINGNGNICVFIVLNIVGVARLPDLSIRGNITDGKSLINNIAIST